MWHHKNHKWLELSEVVRETTDDIRVTAIPFYMGSRVSIKREGIRKALKIKSLFLHCKIPIIRILGRLILT